MSGICGVFHRDGRPVDPAVIRRMAEAAAHRGHDGMQVWTSGQVGMGHLAYNLVPESIGECQPLVSRDGGLVLTADARVDNRDELIHALSAKGLLKDDAPSDAELILAAYQHWGTECAAHIIGDFAFALWDVQEHCLFAARDPMAMRAIYYRQESDRFLFATEVKQILAAPKVPRRIFEPYVAAYLAGHFDELTWTFYEGVNQLPPGHALRVDADGVRTWRYWDIDLEHEIRYQDEEEYVEHFLELFKEAVRCRLRSTRPVGIFLSGGMDSGSLASMAGWWKGSQPENRFPEIHAYSFAFESFPECDERHISNGIVQHYRFPQHDISADAAWPLKDYPAYGPDSDEPYIGTYQALVEESLADARSRGIGLMLSGDRGDLTMGMANYDYVGLAVAGEWATLRDELRLVSQWRGEPFRREVRRQLAKTYHAWIRGRTRAGWIRQVHRRLRSFPSPIPTWVHPEFVKRSGLIESMRRNEHPVDLRTFARQQRYQAVFVSMHMRGVVWSERTQARYGIGFADPWSDRRIVSFAVAVPQRVLNRTGEDKRLARQAMRGIMPEEVRQAVTKIIPYPLYEWAITKKEKDTVLDLTTNMEASRRGFVREEVLRDHFEAICRGETEHPFFWWALTLEMWLRQYWGS